MTCTRTTGKCILRPLAWALGLLVMATGVMAQSSISLLPRPSTAYVPLYSPCRDAAPDEVVAQTFYRALKEGAEFRDYSRQLQALQNRPEEQWSAVDAEAYFLILRQMEFSLPGSDSAAGERIAQIGAGQTKGKLVARQFAQDSYVQCAYRSTEYWLSKSFRLRNPPSPDRLRVARDDYAAFLAAVLKGDTRADTASYILKSRLGQLYLDQGFEQLPDTEKAGRLFEKGAELLLSSAATAADDRYVNGWQRYAFMLDKLPVPSRQQIGGRLIYSAEHSWAAEEIATPAALNTYKHLLALAMQSALSAKNGRGAIAMCQRYLQVVRKLRGLDERDPNPEVDLVLGNLLLGDAYKLAGLNPEASLAFNEADRLFTRASPEARDSLVFQGFPAEIARRKK